MRSPQAAGRFYRPELDVVRFVAFLLVFLHHFLPWGPGAGTAALPRNLAQILFSLDRGLSFGLSLFFTLSAYLICELLLREREATGSVQAKQFYIRRILRIWPLYFAGLVIGVVICLFPGGDPKTIPWAAWSAVLLGNWFIVLHGSLNNPMGPLWSISVEEQFYLMVPWAIKYLNRRLLIAVSIAFIGSANVWLFFLGRIPIDAHAIWYNSFVQFENFAAGMLLCLAMHGRSTRISAWMRLAMLMATAACWCFASLGLKMQYEGNVINGSLRLMGHYGLVALGCAFLLVAFLGLDRKMLPAWAIYLGRISYGLYVFHELAIRTLGFLLTRYSISGGVTTPLKGVCAFALTILLASLSYRYFESPFLRLKKRHEVIESRPV